jgi:hypothetical protein
MQPTPGWGEGRSAKPPLGSTRTWAVGICCAIVASTVITGAVVLATEPPPSAKPTAPSSISQSTSTTNEPPTSDEAAAHGRNIAALIRAQGGTPTVADCEAAFEEGVRGTASGPPFLSNADHTVFLSACLSG